jgi:SnoaL-like domain
MPDDASAAEEPAALAGRIRSALESGDLDAIGELLSPGARWGAPEGSGDFDCRNRDEVIAWWARARAAGARAVVTEVTAGAGALLVGLEVTGTAAAHEAGGAVGRWQVLTVRDRRGQPTPSPARHWVSCCCRSAASASSRSVTVLDWSLRRSCSTRTCCTDRPTGKRCLPLRLPDQRRGA